MGAEIVTTPHTVSYDDLVALPRHLVGEIIDGTLHTHPRPAARHARTSSVLGSRVGGPFDYDDDGPGGWVILFEPELHFPSRRNDLNIVVPDLAGWRRERMPETPDVAHFTLAPDWVCEILSPGTVEFDRVQKINLYARAHVTHVWLIDPRERVLEVFRLTGDLYTRVLAAANDDIVRAEPFDAIELALADLWRM